MKWYTPDNVSKSHSKVPPYNTIHAYFVIGDWIIGQHDADLTIKLPYVDVAAYTYSWLAYNYLLNLGYKFNEQYNALKF